LEKTMLVRKPVDGDGLTSHDFAGMDREAVPFAFLARARALGIKGALVTITQIDGGAPKPVGTHMAILEDGRHVGNVSGGCVEPAIAAQFAPLIAEGRDQVFRFGSGSRFIDIRFPCGGGIDLTLHAPLTDDLLANAMGRVERREAFAIGFEAGSSTAGMVAAAQPTGWQDGVFVRRYLPRTRLVLVGRGPDFEVMARVCAAAEFELVLATPDQSSASTLADLPTSITLMKGPGRPLDLPIDSWTATVLLFHEHEWEDAILASVAGSDAFYVGALGSMKTHRQRRERLAAMGVPQAAIDRIRGPIGLVQRARDPGTLALSVLAEIAAARAQLDQH
jgi:xanthine dehydrogenase accessory factor